MADISMCKGDDCPQKERCYRFLAKQAKRMQSFFRRPPRKNGECEYFWPLDSKKQTKFDFTSK